MANIIESYTNANEAARLWSDNAKRLEFLTTIRVLRDLIPPHSDILDCASGPGAYAIHYAEQGHRLVALDIVPRHIEMLDMAIAGKSYTMQTGVNDAVDLSRLEDNSFDVVLCMGPMYHLVDSEQREKCMAECARVARPGGIVAVAYMSRFSVMPFMATYGTPFLRQSLYDKMVTTGALPADDPDCFWTDSYFSTPEIMEELIAKAGLAEIEHFAADGVSALMSYVVNAMDADTFSQWAEYHYQTCREKSLLGASNHCMIIGKKAG